MRVKVGNQKWERRLVKKIVDGGDLCDGKCYHDEHVIRVRRGLDARTELETDIHELLHAEFRWMEEWSIEQAAEDLTELLFDKLKYRKPQS